MPRFDMLQDDYYKRLGVEQSADIKEIEAAYWRIAKEMRGQAAMAQYTEAYEALASSDRRRDYDAEHPASPAAVAHDFVAPKVPTRAPSKFGWPSQ